MIQKIFSNPHIYQIDIPLPDNPLKNLNCYVIQDNEETLIIDTGFNRPECMEAMKNGLAELGVQWEKTSFFLSHLHSDHVGLVYALTKDKPCPIYMSRADYHYLGDSLKGDSWLLLEEHYEKQGMPAQYTQVLRTTNPARSFAPSGYFDATTLEDGDTITVGRYTFTCILVEGHTPGQMCLYYAPEQILFTADHILFDITPNITSWLEMEDALGDYLKSLKKIRQYPIKLALPSHRKNDMDVYQRIDEIVHHHNIRLKEVLQALAQKPNSNAYETAAMLRWSMRGKSWEEFPLPQRWFALGETMSHLDYLIKRGLVKQHKGDIYHYQLSCPLEESFVVLDRIWEQEQQ
jgi:glyoxylase-like metal-dependent hydrolase (beta-lactamase superfamily II)